MSLRYALLGLLQSRPATGYELTRRFTQGIGRHAWSAKHSQIYPELRKLAEERLIEIVGEGARGKRVYDLTEAGRAELRQWLLSDPADGTIRNPFLLRLFLISGLSPDDAIPILEHIEQHAEDSVAELAATYERIGTDASPAGEYAAMFGIFSYRATGEWARWAITEQRKLAAQQP